MPVQSFLCFPNVLANNEHTEIVEEDDPRHRSHLLVADRRDKPRCDTANDNDQHPNCKLHLEVSQSCLTLLSPSPSMPDFDVVESYHRSGRSADDEFDLPRFQPRTLPIATAAGPPPSSNPRYLAGPPPASSSSSTTSNMNSYYAPPPPPVQNTYSPSATTSGGAATTTTSIPQQSFQSQLQPQRQHSTRLSQVADTDVLQPPPSSSTSPTTWTSGLGRSASLSGMVRGARHGNNLPPDDVERAFGDLPANGGSRMMGPATMKQHSPPSAVQHTFYSSSISYQPPQEHRTPLSNDQPSYSLRRSNTSVHSCVFRFWAFTPKVNLIRVYPLQHLTMNHPIPTKTLMGLRLIIKLHQAHNRHSPLLLRPPRQFTILLSFRPLTSPLTHPTTTPTTRISHQRIRHRLLGLTRFPRVPASR